jgi:hypothetical protein
MSCPFVHAITNEVIAFVAFILGFPRLMSLQKAVTFIQKSPWPVLRGGFSEKCHSPLIFTWQTAHPLFELTVKGGCAIEPTTTIDFGQRVVLLVEQLQAFLDTVARKKMMESRAGETPEQTIEMIGARAAVPGCVREPDLRLRVIFFDESPKSLQPTGVDTLPSNLR